MAVVSVINFLFDFIFKDNLPFCYISWFLWGFFLFLTQGSILPEIPALFQAIVQPTDPKSRPETARKPPLQHERRGHHLNNNITAVNMTQQCLTHAEEVITHVCVITLLPESSRAHLSPGPPSIVCHSSWRWAGLAEGCGRPERRCSATHGQSQV